MDIFYIVMLWKEGYIYVAVNFLSQLILSFHSCLFTVFFELDAMKL